MIFDLTLKILRYFEYFLSFLSSFYLKPSIIYLHCPSRTKNVKETWFFKNVFLWNRSLVVNHVVRDRKILNSIFSLLSEKRYGAAKRCRFDIWFPVASRQNVLFTGTQTKNPIAAEWQRAAERLRIDPGWRHLTGMQQSHLIGCLQQQTQEQYWSRHSWKWTDVGESSIRKCSGCLQGSSVNNSLRCFQILCCVLEIVPGDSRKTFERRWMIFRGQKDHTDEFTAINCAIFQYYCFNQR